MDGREAMAKRGSWEVGYLESMPCSSQAVSPPSSGSVQLRWLVVVTRPTMRSDGFLHALWTQ